MRDATNRGAPIEIEDFERRLRNQEARRASLGDPLRELARLMQERETDDASQRYGQIFDDHHQPSEEAGADREAPAAHGALNAPAPDEDYAPHSVPQESPESFSEEDLPPPLRGSYAEEAEESFYADELPQNDQHALTPVAHDADYGAFDHEPAAEYYPQHDGYEEFPAEPYAEPGSAEPEESKRGFRVKPWHAVAVASLVGALGVGWGIARIKGVAGSREIATIAAPSGPTKVAPVADTGQAVKEDATVLDRGVETPVRNVVPHQEAPVEPVVEPPREASNETFRRVKTVAIHEDSGVNPATAPAAVVRAANDAAAPPPAVSTTTPQNNAPPPATTAQKQPPKKKVAVAAPTEPVKPVPSEAKTDAPSEQAAEPAPIGSASVQFGAAPNENEARALAKKVVQKYGSHLGGRHPTWKLAEVGDKTVYRVRVGGLSKQAAASLCKSVKSDGGDCYVAGN